VNSEFRALADSLQGHVFADQDQVSSILAEVSAGALSEADGVRQLRQVESGAERGPFAMTTREANEEWKSLLTAMSDEALAWQQIAKRQFNQGFLLLPLMVAVVIGVLLYLSATLPGDELAVAAEPLLAACLAAIATHAFFIFRVHQQARVAAERLSEKRAAILFLRIALSRTDPEESARLLQAGTAMFLGHHAMTAVPLQPADRPSGPADRVSRRNGTDR
jgi:hypothetical protein